MTMHGALHPRDDVDRLYVSRKEGGRGLVSIEDSVDAPICPWFNSYRRWKWIRRHEFKSWTRLVAFHMALIALGMLSIQLFSLEQWVNSRAD